MGCAIATPAAKAKQQIPEAVKRWSDLIAISCQWTLRIPHAIGFGVFNRYATVVFSGIPTVKWMNFDRSVARLIDHTILKPEAVRDEIRQTCAEAMQFEFASVCINPFWTKLVAAELGGSPVKVCTVAGFPLGANHPAAKVAETLGALRDGADEIDMVINIGALRSGEREVVKSDIQGVVLASHGHGAIVKVIIETALLDDAQKLLACRLAQDAGADFVKTSTGFSKAGATVPDVMLMRRAVGSSMGVKASGGIRTLADLKAMVAAGATRVGASASVKIMQESALDENTERT
jgi:deoxyribose-phosphate aldolase